MGEKPRTKADRLPVSISDIETEHHELHDLLITLQNRFAADPPDFSMVPSLLESLVLHLETHFEREEKGGWFDDLVEAAPRVAPQTRKLTQDHRELLTIASNLANRSKQPNMHEIEWKLIAEEYEQLYNALEDHEKHERDLLNEVYVRDVGSKD